MAATKRPLEEASSPKAKKTKVSPDKRASSKSENARPSQSTSSYLVSEEIDFPRGGGTSLTPLEVKTIRAEAVKEANEELFEDAKVREPKAKHKGRKSDSKAKRTTTGSKNETNRVEHLNYKRIVVGMKILGQIVSVQPLALIVSLSNQLWAHVPITQVSSQLTARLEAMDADEEKSDSDASHEEDAQNTVTGVPDLFEIFHPGQYVRAVVTAVHQPGSTDMTGIGRAMDETQKASRRVELSLVPEKVNEGVIKADLKSGLTLSAAVKSIEDHGYILELGIPDVSGFLSYREAKKGPVGEKSRLHVGQLVDVAVAAMSGNGRSCTVIAEPKSVVSATLSVVASVTSILPGALVQSLITAVLHNGLNLQILGSFEGTVDDYHVGVDNPQETWKVGQKVKGRVLYDIGGTSPPRFALSLAQHITDLGIKRTSLQEGLGLPDAYPIGTVLDAVQVLRVETERGLVVEVEPSVKGFIHISHTSDDHVPMLSPSSGPWKLGSTHEARVTGHFPLDGLLQLSLRPSVLGQKFLRVGDVEVGAVIKGTVKKLTETAMFVSISGNVDGVIWPNHYADIALKHPQKRYKPASTLHCRVLVVNPERQRIVLTAKRTLIESELPIIAKLEDAKVGLVTHAVVFKVYDKNLHVEFYNNLKGIIPFAETSEASVNQLSVAFPIGKPVKVRIISVDPEKFRIIASIRQAASNFKPVINDISGVEIGNIVQGVVAEIHKDNIVLDLQPTQARAILSLGNLANHRGLTVAQLRVAVKVGDGINDLIVVSRSPEKGIVIVASRPKSKEPFATKGSISMDTLQAGQIVGGRLLRHSPRGAYIKLTSHIHGSLHPTDACDDYGTGSPFPAVDSVLKAVVIAIDKDKKHVTLSTRPSRMHQDSSRPIVDREIQDVGELKVGDSVRGFIKSVTEHGLFVTLGREVDARVQIKELFDEFVKDWKSGFEANQLVKGRILSVDTKKKQVEMSFRSGDLNKRSGSSLSLANIHEGQKVDGRVKKIEDYGLFIEIEGSRLTGLCHKSELSDNKDADVTLALRSFREGDLVKAIVLAVDLEKRRISLGLKPSYFIGDDIEMLQNSDLLEEEESHDALGVVDDDEKMSEGDFENAAEDDPNELSGSASVSEDESDVQVDLDKPFIVHSYDLDPSNTNERPDILPSASSLTLQGFDWGGKGDLSEEDMESGSSSGVSDGEEKTKKRRKRRRKEIEQDLTAGLHLKTPESNADFERLLLGSPNSSFLWIQYMSFQLRLAEVEKARAIARRAFGTINFREEAEKLNVWVALLNLENSYGNDDSLENTFKEAARSNDSKTVHLRLAAIFDQSEKYDRAEAQYKRTSKKFGQSSKVWTLFCEHYLKRGKVEEARKLLPRSLQSLEKRKHLKTISRFAQMEYKLADPERGRTIFEGIIDSHPKRHDLWSIYIDMEAVQGDIQNIRNVFERVLGQKMTSHKAKSFFKKWLELERKLGNDDGQMVVKQKAIEWTQRAAGSV